jgi:hypothetical protein
VPDTSTDVKRRLDRTQLPAASEQLEVVRVPPVIALLAEVRPGMRLVLLLNGHPLTLASIHRGVGG